MASGLPDAELADRMVGQRSLMPLIGGVWLCGVKFVAADRELFADSKGHERIR